MPREKRRKKSEYDDYTERLIPTRVTITKERDGLTFVFTINGFRGTETGQIYYKGKDVLEIERFLDKRNAIQTQEIEKLGLVLKFETPQTCMASDITGAYPPILAPEIFQPKSSQWLRVPETAGSR